MTTNEQFLIEHYRKLGKKGGKARAKSLTAAQRSEIARKAGSAPKRKRVHIVDMRVQASKGGKARHAKLPAERQSEIGRKAGLASAAARAEKRRQKALAGQT